MFFTYLGFFKAVKQYAITVTVLSNKETRINQSVSIFIVA